LGQPDLTHRGRVPGACPCRLAVPASGGEQVDEVPVALLVVRVAGKDPQEVADRLVDSTPATARE
jgi:hypothetical protein